MSRGTRIVAALALCLVAACSHSRAGTLPTPSRSPDATRSVPPPTSDGPADFGVAQAVRDYYSALERAVHAPGAKTDDLAGRIDRSCGCYRIVGVLREEARHGRHADYTLTVESLSVPNASPSAGTAFATVVQSAGRLYDAEGAVVERIEATTDSYVIDVRAAGGRWLVTRISAR